jgi:hypothetical protein
MFLGIKPSFLPEYQEDAENFIYEVNRALRAVGSGPYADPEVLPIHISTAGLAARRLTTTEQEQSRPWPNIAERGRAQISIFWLQIRTV